MAGEEIKHQVCSFYYTLNVVDSRVPLRALGSHLKLSTCHSAAHLSRIQRKFSSSYFHALYKSTNFLLSVLSGSHKTEMESINWLDGRVTPNHTLKRYSLVVLNVLLL